MTWRVAWSLGVLLAEVNRLAPKRSIASDGSIGDPAHSARASDHNPNAAGVVRARDFTHHPAGGLDGNALAANLALLLGKHPAMQSGAYVIWNRRIISADRLSEGWRPYSGTNPHDHHVHVSVATNAGGYDSTAPWLVTKEDVVHSAVGFNMHEARTAEPVRRLLQQLDPNPDVVGLVEARFARPSLVASFPRYRTIKRGGDGPASRELALLLHERCEHKFARYVHAADGVGDKGPKHWPRGILIEQYDKDGEDATAIVTHFGFDAEQNKAHVRKVKRIAKRRLAKGDVVWVLADANTAVRRLRRVLEQLGMHVHVDGPDLVACSLPFNESVVAKAVTGSDHNAITARTRRK